MSQRVEGRLLANQAINYARQCVRLCSPLSWTSNTCGATALGTWLDTRKCEHHSYFLFFWPSKANLSLPLRLHPLLMGLFQARHRLQVDSKASLIHLLPPDPPLGPRWCPPATPAGNQERQCRTHPPPAGTALRPPTPPLPPSRRHLATANRVSPTSPGGPVPHPHPPAERNSGEQSATA